MAALCLVMTHYKKRKKCVTTAARFGKWLGLLTATTKSVLKRQSLKIMSKVLILSGLPASGKSTYAEELVKGGGNWVRINRDLLRTMLHFDKWSGPNEGMTINAARAIAERALYNGKNVIIDDTNLKDNGWAMIAKRSGAKVEMKRIDTDVWECIKRDEKRENKVGRAVILNMAMQYDLVPGLKKIVVCDIDGTVADCEHRKHYLEGEKKDWKGFFSEMGKDTPRHHIYDDAMDMAVHHDGELIFVSARPEDYREETEEWLRYYGMDHLHLIMRRSGDKRPDVDVKEDIYNKYLQHYEIVKVYDDRPCVIRMWESNGLDVVDVGPGYEF